MSKIKDINYCGLDPCTHGSCIDEVASHMCVCNPGYTGQNCSEGTNKCYSFIYLVCNKLQQY